MASYRNKRALMSRRARCRKRRSNKMMINCVLKALFILNIFNTSTLIININLQKNYLVFLFAAIDANHILIYYMMFYYYFLIRWHTNVSIYIIFVQMLY